VERPDRSHADGAGATGPAPIARPKGRGARAVRRLAVALLVISAAVGLGRLAWPGVRREVRLRLAERAMARGDLADAEDRLGRLIRDRPEETRPRLLGVQLARRLGRITEAEEGLQRAVELGLPVEDGRREFALIAALEDFPRAEGSLRRVVAEHPGDREAHRALAEGYARARRWAEAASACSAWLDRAPDEVDAQLLRARANRASGSRDKSEADLRAILDRDPDHYPARLLRGDWLRDDGKLAEAEPDFLACRRLRPDRPEPLVGLAGCASGRGDSARAEALLDHALTLAPNSPPTLRARCGLHVARGRDDLAIPLLERLTALDPADGSAPRQLARIYRQAGDEPRAREHEARTAEREARAKRFPASSTPGDDRP